MKYKALYILFLLGLGIKSFSHPPGSFIKTADGIIVYPDADLSGNAPVIRLQVINNNIIRVTASAAYQLPDVKSLISVLNHPLKTSWNILKERG